MLIFTITDEAEAAKSHHHRDRCEANGYEYLTAAATTYGGIGSEFYDQYFKPYYKKAKAAAKASGESEWLVERDRMAWVTAFGVAIAHCNRIAVGAARRRALWPLPLQRLPAAGLSERRPTARAWRRGGHAGGGRGELHARRELRGGGAAERTGQVVTRLLAACARRTIGNPPRA